ncbi:hypothetical protein [Frankia sp. AgB32]|uniref:hypothetical protein n=1 Tax=Frankia sp. AgB32 TaxID=631119 RepID=UPI00200BDF49|nr:hypothetical protein [Frankia sp. AgB32]MCK9896183.1 hypothetical protein [Frankia sp. AgB32]
MSASATNPANMVPPGGTVIHGKKQDLVVTDRTISIGGRAFELAAVDRVVYRSAARINQASYRIGVGQGDETCLFTFDAYKRGTELADSRRLYGQVVEVLEAVVCPAIAAAAARAVTAGQTVTFGSSPAARINADAEGLRPRRPFARTVPWSRIVHADLHQGQARVWTAGSGDAEDGRRNSSPAMSMDMMGWNAVVLPRVVGLLGRR